MMDRFSCTGNDSKVVGADILDNPQENIARPGPRRHAFGPIPPTDLLLKPTRRVRRGRSSFSVPIWLPEIAI